MTPEDLQKARTMASVCTEKLSLPLHSRVWKGQAGEFLGAGSGSSLDFQDPRTYVPGDDPRHINWQAYARSGNYTMKLYREEVRPVIDFVADVSASMFFEPTKAQRALELFYFIIDGALRVGASLRIHLVCGESHQSLAPDALRGEHWLDQIEKLQTSDTETPPSLNKIPFRANTFRVFLSALLFPQDPNETIRLLGQRQGSPIIFVPYTKEEATPDWQGNYEFVDAESQSRHPHRIEPAILKRYQKAYLNHFSLWKTSARRYGALMARVSADTDLETALHAEAVPTGALSVTN